MKIETDQGLKEALAEMFVENELGLTPITNPNGADSYECPCCKESKTMKGNVFGVGSMRELEHAEDCKLQAAFEYIRLWDANRDD